MNKLIKNINLGEPDVPYVTADVLLWDDKNKVRVEVALQREKVLHLSIAEFEKTATLEAYNALSCLISRRDS
jgi:hypothetical protein